jgi:ATP-binding cassette subfamily F protein 3
MIELDHISLRRGSDLLFSDSSLGIGPGWHIGITGRNGTGKSSLLALLRGELETESGAVHLPADWRTASMAQEVPASEQPALDYVLDGNTALREAEQALATARDQGDGHAEASAHARLDDLDAWSAPARAAALLSGLGFAQRDHQRPLSDFSGGWRMRLNIARVLMADAELLLLDEPTNHLDLDAVLWLQGVLRRSRSTLLLISHDREFLDACVDHIVHIEQQKLHHYSGNYSAFEQRRAEHLAQQQQLHDKQQAEVARLQGFIDRFRAKATKARQAQSRIKALERMEMIAPAHVDAGFSFSFQPPDKLPNPMINFSGVTTGYGDTTVLEDISLSLRPESRIGLLGPNGAGKSTLMKLLAGRLEVLSGDAFRDKHLRVGYFEQQQVDALPPQESPLSLLRERQPDMDEQAMRDYLGGFGFRGDDVEAPVRQFSGGEKSRLGLALLIRERPSLLLMDEPANHLDLDMREALTLALQSFEGALVIVSHDRHLLDTTVDEFRLVAHGTVSDWPGDLDDYARWLREQKTDANGAAGDQQSSQDSARQRRRDAADKRARLKPLKDQVGKLEDQLSENQRTLHTLDEQLADSSLYEAGQKDELNTLLARQGALRAETEQLEESLLEAMEALEAAEQTD